MKTTKRPKKDPHAVALGRKGGKVTSEAKTLAARENAKQPRRRTLKAVLIGLGLLAATATMAHAEGWYFMLPPIVKDGTKQPLWAWHFTAAQPSAATCELFKANFLEYSKGQYFETKKPSALVVMNLAPMGQCVRANDPRLKRAQATP